MADPGAEEVGEGAAEAARPPQRTGEGRLPGDLPPQAMVERIIRVDHAGEYGARRIYQGQLAMLERVRDPGARRSVRRRRRDQPGVAEVRRMAEQEADHLRAFEALMIERRVRPSVLLPLWHVAGFALGAATAALGARAAMACTIAVEEAIEDHYRGQSARLGDDEAGLRAKVDAFGADEVAHRQAAEAAGGRDIAGYAPLAAAIKLGSRVAIWLSERI